MSDAVSANPVERAQAELEAAMAEFNQLVSGDDPGQGDGSEPLVDDLYFTQNDPQHQMQQQKPQDSDSNNDSYKQKWQSLQGIVRSKDAQIETLTSQIQSLMEQNQTIMAQLQSAGNDQGQSQQQSGGDLSASDLDNVAHDVREKYGDELGDVFAKFANHVKTIEQRVKPIEEKTRNMDAREAEVKAEMKLTQLCSNWKQLDSDKNFIKWLERKAPYTNKKLVDVLNDSYRSGDIETTAAIFNEYNELTRKTAGDPRDGMVTPDTRGTAGFQGDTNQPKVWREKDAAQFFRDVQTGKYRGREADAQRIEAEISQAYLEGRVR